jgi:hypothetical protein
LIVGFPGISPYYLINSVSSDTSPRHMCLQRRMTNILFPTVFRVEIAVTAQKETDANRSRSLRSHDFAQACCVLEHVPLGKGSCPCSIHHTRSLFLTEYCLNITVISHREQGVFFLVLSCASSPLMEKGTQVPPLLPPLPLHRRL